MKNLYSIAILLFTFSIQGQIINLPDANFKAKLIALGVDDNGNGEIEMAETVDIYDLQLQNSNITSLEGIQYFTEMDWLDCSGNNISDLSVLNGFPYFFSLNCSNNNLTNLDLSNFYSITNLNCSYNQITSLDLSNTLYTVLELYVHNNNLITLNIKGSILFIMGKYKNIIFVDAKFSRNIFDSFRFRRTLVC
jgi:Leucine-rich repeat (LRR) protein